MKHRTTTELKQLQTRQQKITSELKVTEDIIEKAVKKRNTLKERVQSIEHQIDKLLKKEPVVSEHAMLRFLERFGSLYQERYENLDLAVLRKMILPDSIKIKIIELGDGKYPVNNKFTIIVKENIVVTVI